MPNESRFDGIAVMPVTFCYPNMPPKILSIIRDGSRTCMILGNGK
jgi:hypothetical protein